MFQGHKSHVMSGNSSTGSSRHVEAQSVEGYVFHEVGSSVCKGQTKGGRDWGFSMAVRTRQSLGPLGRTGALEESRKLLELSGQHVRRNRIRADLLGFLMGYKSGD